jgi:hypothetical protein
VGAAVTCFSANTVRQLFLEVKQALQQPHCLQQGTARNSSGWRQQQRRMAAAGIGSSSRLQHNGSSGASIIANN